MAAWAPSSRPQRTALCTCLILPAAKSRAAARSGWTGSTSRSPSGVSKAMPTEPSSSSTACLPVRLRTRVAWMFSPTIWNGLAERSSFTSAVLSRGRTVATAGRVRREADAGTARRCGEGGLRGRATRVVVAAEERVAPGAGAAQVVVLDHDRALEHRALLAVGLETAVGVGPDAGVPRDLAHAVAGAAAGAVALVLLAVALGAQVGDVGEAAVAAVAAVVERDLDRLLEHVERLAQVEPLDGLVDPRHARKPGVPGSNTRSWTFRLTL